jgi:hypothetical protein
MGTYRQIWRLVVKPNARTAAGDSVVSVLKTNFRSTIANTVRGRQIER